MTTPTDSKNCSMRRSATASDLEDRSSYERWPDSPTLAATACKILRGRSTDSEVRAFTTVVDGLDGNEGYYAGLVAQRLGINSFLGRWCENNRFHWQETGIHTPEPCTGLLMIRTNSRMICDASS